MSAKIIDGTAIANEIKAILTEKVKTLQEKKGIAPGLAVVIVGDNPASRVYVNMKKKACAQLGIYSEEHTIAGDCSEDELSNLIKKLNNDRKIHGILVQLPLPDQIDESKILNLIDVKKDVDGFHPISVGKLVIGEDCFLPCTPNGIVELIHRTGIQLKGKNVTIVGRSNIVGKPTAFLLLREHATITICHSRTADLKGECKRADVLVAAIGKPEMITADYIKPGAVVIDVGVNRIDTAESKKLVGDVNFEEAKEIAGYITPVPGGVGPMTITMLMNNTVVAAGGEPFDL